MADGETATTEYTIGWQPQKGPQTALLACPVFEVFFGGPAPAPVPDHRATIGRRYT